MPFRIETDQVNSAEWSRLLELFDDANIYQTWAYGAIRWGDQNLSHLVLRSEGQVAAVAQIRIVRPPWVRAGIAYLRWGPVCHLHGRELDPGLVRAVMAALHEEYVQKRRLYLRILPNAFFGSERAGVFQAGFGKFTGASLNHSSRDRTFLLNLAPSIEDLRKKLDQKWRNQLNRAEKNGLIIIEGNGAEAYETFAQIYKEMWSRKRFDTSVDVNEFCRICQTLPDRHKLRILICQLQGVPVSGIVCSAMGTTGIYLLGATNSAGLNAKGAYLLQWSMIKWLKENGYQYYDLGGIDPELNPGVYHFKSGLSGQDVSRIAPLEACDAFISSVCMKAADFAQGGLRGALSTLASRSLRSVMQRWRGSLAADKLP